MRPAIFLLTVSFILRSQSVVTPMFEPALSPDHSEIAFVSGGDIWTVPFSGGEARLLISNPATESHPLYSPDGTRLAFVSNRTGNGDIYVLRFRTGELKRITFDDNAASLNAWSPDSNYLYFSSNRNDVAQMDDIYKVPSTGGTPIAVAADRYSDESQAAPNPVDGSIAFVSGAMAVSQWWRKGHAHIDETTIALVKPSAAGPQYSQLLPEDHAKNLWPMWSADGKTLYFVSDRSGSENLWRLTSAGPAHQITKFTGGRLLWASISRDGKAIAFERGFRIWTMNPDGTRCAPVETTLRGVPAGPTTSHVTLTANLRNLALSSDGKKIAFTAHGVVFAASAKDGGDSIRLTRTPGNEESLAWAPDNKRLLYVSDRDGIEHLYLYDLAKETEVQITSGALKDENPVWSPDGKQIAFLRNSRDVHIVNLETKQDRLVASSKFRTAFLRNPLSWSPDGEWLAFFNDDTRGFKNVAVVPASGGEAKPVSYLANMFADSVLWSADHRYVLFNTGQRTENNSIARVDLVPSTPKFREDQFRDLFHDEPQPAKPPITPAVKPAQPVRITFEGIRRRLTFLPLGLDARAQAISPDGKTLLFTADAGGQENLYTYSLDDLARQPAVPRQLTSTAGRKSNAQFSPDGKEVFFIDAGHISVVVIDTRIVRPLAVTAELDIDFAKEKKEVFRQAWTILNETYYDPKFHGADWSALRDLYAPMIEGARTPDEVRRVISLMIGELNSSHSGINGGPSATRQPVTGRLGLDLDPSDNTVTAVVPLGPADIAGIKPGEKLLAIDGKTLDPTVNIDELLQYKIGKRTILTTSAKKEIPVLPINTVTQKRLLYRQWVEENRAYVHKISGGRLGYVHMLDMSSRALDQLHIDLDTENENRDGVVIDIRNNNGGFVNAYALDVFSRRPYLTMTPRDRPSSPARSMLGQRSLELPTVLVVNQNSLSDAEDFTEGYRTLKLGKVVGVPTAGWIIYTGGEDLIDGSALRTPSIRITANDGTDMELHPRPVDIEVGRPLGESYIGRDMQLERAVKSLLADLK